VCLVMIRIAISVEGQTEDEFCKKVLTPFFQEKEIVLTPVIITTSKNRKTGEKHKGGAVNLDRVKNEVKKLLPDFNYVSTFYDLYAFGDRKGESADELEHKLFSLFNDKRFIPYIQQYEFETLLFSQPECFTEYFKNDTISKQMKQIIEDFGNNIEKINDSSETSPSKRLINLFKSQNETYNKVFHGEGIAYDIGLDMIRSKAKRFDQWIEKIINLL
jgi:hypothetical protein